MEEGYILDHGDADLRKVNTWVEGKPVKSFWAGLRIKDKEQYSVKTFRCAGCGYLESYALEEKDQGSVFS